jgi:hypothetical protein
MRIQQTHFGNGDNIAGTTVSRPFLDLAEVLVTGDGMIQ